jgi:hypothetical protein
MLIPAFREEWQELVRNFDDRFVTGDCMMSGNRTPVSYQFCKVFSTSGIQQSRFLKRGDAKSVSSVLRNPDRWISRRG